MRFAENTSVSPERSRSEIEKVLTRYGADQFVYGWDHEKALVGFRMNGKQVKFLLPLPDKNDSEFQTTPSGRRQRSAESALKAWEQACRQGWRALALVIKAKLEAVESGITTFEEEFLAHLVLPNGQTVGDWACPQINQLYSQKKMPLLLPGVGG